MARKQILSNEALNSKGFHVINSTLDWGRYLKKPILLRNPHSGEHYGEPIGRVENIRLDAGNYIGDLVFGSSPLAKQAQKDYDDGILNGVSIFGKARIAERNGKRYTTYFDVWEISLVNIPANPDAVAIRDKQVGLSVDFGTLEIEEVVSLSASDNDIINKFEQTMLTEEQKPAEIAGAPKEEMVSLSVLEKVVNFFRPQKSDDTIVDAALSVEKESVAEQTEEGLSAEEQNAEEETEETGLDTGEGEEDLSAEAEGEADGLAAGDAPETTETPPTGLAAGADARIFNGTNQTTKKMSVKPFFKFVEDEANASKLERIVALSAASGDGDGLTTVGLSAEGGKETLEAIQELAASMQADKGLMATIQNISFTVNGGRTTKVTETIAALASGHGAAEYIQNADLAKIVWISLFIRQLFPNNRWARRVRRLPMQDREGILWVESAMNPEVYFGDRAPVNAQNYLYDDMPRGISRKVFALQPIVWQSSNTDILGYNDVATGNAEAMAIMVNAIHTYWLQVIAESIPATGHVLMSGNSFAAANRFPINPAAAGNLHGLTTNDVIALNGKFLAQNLPFTSGSGVMVLAEPYFTSLAQEDDIKSILTRQLAATTPDTINYSGFDISTRSMIAGYNTATSTVVDAEKYYDKPVDWATGAIDDTHVSPVLAATVYDIGLAFVPEEVVVGIGNTNIHMVSDPNNYGWKMSMDIATGAGLLRSSAAGVALLRPTIEELDDEITE